MRRLVGLVVLLALARVASAADYGLTPEAVAPGVYVLWGVQEGLTPENGGHIANTGFIVGEEAVLVVEAGPTRAYGEQVLAAIAALTPLPVAAVVVTHHHQDHALAIPAYTDRGLRVIMHAAAAPALARDAPALLGFMTDLIGAGWTEGTTVGAPSETISGSLSVDLGGRSVAVQVLAGGHTPGDLVVVDAASGTIFAGDLVFNGRAATVPHAHIATWRSHLGRLIDSPWQRLVPGHGPLVEDRADVREVADYLTFLEQHSACSYRWGDSPVEAIQQPPPPPFDTLAIIDKEYQRSIFQLFRAYDTGPIPDCG
jgi:quinoprotein relay system zinc metallohydrolase 1